MQKIKIAIFIILLYSLNVLANEENKVKNFILKDYNNNEYSLFQFEKSNAIVVMFISARCPISNDYNRRMEAISNKYSPKGVTFLGINSNKSEDIEEIKKHANENELTFLILKDVNNSVADQFDAKFTPEIFVINREKKIVYHGRIDDSRKIESVESNDLDNALNEVLSGKEVSNPLTKAFGCSIKRIEK